MHTCEASIIYISKCHEAGCSAVSFNDKVFALCRYNTALPAVHRGAKTTLQVGLRIMSQRQRRPPRCQTVCDHYVDGKTW